MSTFAFRAVDLAGRPSRGEVEAPSKSSGLRSAPPARPDRPRHLRGARGVQARERSSSASRASTCASSAVFSRQFATLIASGMPMLRSLYTLEDQTEDPMLQAGDHSLAQRRRGRQLADARRWTRQPGVFDPALPLDGRRRRGLWSPRGVAGPRRRPARKARLPQAPGEVGDDVSGRRLHGRVCS